MKLKITKSVKLLLTCIISFSLSLILFKTQANTINIKVDVNHVLADVSNNPIGMNMNFLRDNTQITYPLKDIKVGSLRYPIGELADYYLFDKNNPARPQVSINDSSLWFSKLFNSDGIWNTKLSFDDFMSICGSVGAEPFIMVGIDAITYPGSSPHAKPEDVLEAAVEWVKYANIVKGYGIKYWEIGNENDLKNDWTSWTAEKYAETVVLFSRAMKEVDPSIKIGANAFSWTNWWDKMLPIIKNDVDFLVAHQYSSMKSYQEWKDYVWDYTSNIKAAKKAIKTYNPNLRINVTEISSRATGADRKNPNLAKNSNWRVLHNFEVIGNSLRFAHVDYVHFWVSRWFDGEDTARHAFNSSYESMPMSIPLKIWGNFLKKQMVYSSKLDSIRSWASYDPDDDSLNLFLLNKDEVAHNVNILLDNYLASTQQQPWVLSSTTPESMNLTWEQSGSVSVNGSKISTQLNPLSVTVIELQGSK